MSEIRGPVEHRDNPYFGLEYYDERFGAWFFGREVEGSRIISNLRAARLTLLYAGSGIGKSSLLRAGAAWRLRRAADDSLERRGTPRFVPVVFSSWKDDPVADLTAAINMAIEPYLAGRHPPRPADQLRVAIEEASSAVNATLLIMLDQFEEYFLYLSREQGRGRFADELASCINRAEPGANFLIAIREDAYGVLGDLFKDRIVNVYSNYLRIAPLDRATAEEAIRAPLTTYNSQPGVSARMTIQHGLVEAVLDEVGTFGVAGDVPPGAAATADSGIGYVAMPILQLVMERIWEIERAEGSHELRLSTLQSLGGSGTIIDRHVARALSSLSRGERQTAIDALDHLVTPSGVIIAQSVPDLGHWTGQSEARVGSVLEKLDRERLVRSVPAPPGQDPTRFRRYEVFHSVLGPGINRAVGAASQQRRVRRTRHVTVTVGLLFLALVGMTIIWAILITRSSP